MSGLFRRMKRSRAAGQEPPPVRHDIPSGAPAPPAGAAGGPRVPEAPDRSAAGAGARPTTPLAPGAPVPLAVTVRAPGGGAVPIPAGLEPVDVLPDRPTSKRRGRLRRRLRHLRRVREVLLRDLGGLVFDVHRFADPRAEHRHAEVVAMKLRRLAAVDTELRELEERLADRRPAVLREPGIGGVCPSCGEIFGSEASYCWRCGTQVGATGGGTGPMLGVVPGSRASLAATSAGAVPAAEPAHEPEGAGPPRPAPVPPAAVRPPAEDAAFRPPAPSPGPERPAAPAEPAAPPVPPVPPGPAPVLAPPTAEMPAVRAPDEQDTVVLPPTGAGPAPVDAPPPADGPAGAPADEPPPADAPAPADEPPPADAPAPAGDREPGADPSPPAGGAGPGDLPATPPDEWMHTAEPPALPDDSSRRPL